MIEYHLYLIDYTLTLRNAQDLFREVILVAYWPTRVHDHQTALKQSTAGGSYAMSTAWPSPERLPAAVERSGAPSSTLGCTTDDVVANRSDASASY